MPTSNSQEQTKCGAKAQVYIYTYKRVVCVCLFVGLFVCFLSATRHLSTLRRCLRVRESRSRRGRSRARGQACTCESTRAHAVQLLNEKNVSWCLSKTKPYARACCRIRNWRDFQKKGKRKPTCHFPSSVYSLPSLGVFTFRIVLNRTWSLVGADLGQLVYIYTHMLRHPTVHPHPSPNTHTSIMRKCKESLLTSRVYWLI